MTPTISTYDDILAELTRRRMDLADIAKQCNASRQYTRTIIFQRIAGVMPAPGTKGANILAAIDAALTQPTASQGPVAVGKDG